MCKNSGQFILFPYGILAALCPMQSASSDWLHLAADIHLLPTFLLNLELVHCPGTLILNAKQKVFATFFKNKYPLGHLSQINIVGFGFQKFQLFSIYIILIIIFNNSLQF